MARRKSTVARPDTSDVRDNSIVYLATTIEAVAARIRASAGRADCWRVLEWASDELDRLGTEGRDIADEARIDETEAARG